MIEQKGGLQIIHVDDDHMQTDIIGAVFRKIGYGVVSFNDPNEALGEIIRRLKNNPSGMVLVTDGNMPGMNGGELATRVRKEQNGGGVPIVLVTGSRQFEDEYPGVFDVIVPKPYHLRDLIQSVATAPDMVAKRRETS